MLNFSSCSSAVASSLALCLVLSGCSGEAPTERPNVVLICLDTVRADHLGAYGYEARPTTPFMDRLATRSLFFTDASSTAGWTKPSVPSFLTGTMPAQHGVYEGSARFDLGATTDILPEEATTMAEVFRDHGYRTAAFIRNAQLRPGNGFEQGFETYRDEIGDARAIRWEGVDWIDASTKSDGDRPFFLYLHFLDAHWPYPIPDEYATLFAARELVAPFQDKGFRATRDAVHSGEREFTEAERDSMVALYDGALRYLDDQLALLWEALERRDLAKNTIVCILSDHGEEFGEFGRIGHGHGLGQHLLHVPWILYAPHLPAQRIDGPSSLLDVFPTLLAAAGIYADPPSLGIDRIHAPEQAVSIVAEHKGKDFYMQSLREENTKVLRTIRPRAWDSPSDMFPVRLGERWEAELVRSSDGSLIATQLKPREEDPSEPTELKGRVSELEGDTLSIEGIRVRLTDGYELQGAVEANGGRLSGGALVKVRGHYDGEQLLANRVKLYPPGEEGDFELRGLVSQVDSEGLPVTVTIGGLRVATDGRTDFKGVDGLGDRKRMTRDQVVSYLSVGGEPANFDVEAELVPLSEPNDDSPGQGILLETLDRIGRELVQTRVFTSGDRLLLTPDTLERLRALGYVE